MKRLVLIVAALVTLAVTAAPAGAQYGGSQGFLIDPAQGYVGDQVNFLGAACGANQTVIFVVVETGAEIARTTTGSDSDGSFFLGGVTIPDLPPGMYTIEARCTNGGRTVVANLTVLALPAVVTQQSGGVSGTGTPRGPLAFTGNREPAPLLKAGTVLVAAGLVLVLAVRRRRDADPDTAPAAR